MIHFPPILTARLNVQLRELTLKEAVELAATPLALHETATAALLAFIVEKAAGPNDKPGAWTVQERMFVVAHYIACTTEGNFSLGDGRFLDYLQGDIDAAPELVDVGQACGDAWRMRQLTGDEALAMESVCKSRMDWLTADMAARLVVVGKDEGRPDASTRPADFAAWLTERKGVLQAMPESEFEELFDAYERGRAELHHLFWLGFEDDGHVVLPKTTEGGGESLAPARFPVAAVIGRVARYLGQRPDRQGRLP